MGRYMKCSGKELTIILQDADGTHAETRFRFSAKRAGPFKPVGGVSSVDYWRSRGVRISGSNAGYTMFLGSVKGTGYPLHSPVSPSLPPPCVTVSHHVSTGLCFHNMLTKQVNPLKPSGYTI
jgi:hypothetical protein